MNKKITQFRWLAATIMLVAAMVMPSVAWAQSYDTNGFGSGSDPYQPATKTTDKYDIDGDGTTDEVYEIGNAGQLYWFADKVNNENVTYGSANAVLTTSITVNSSLIGNLNADGTVKETYEVRNWTPIGWYDNANSVEYYYSGTFDGNDNTISGLYYNVESSDKYVFAGLFGRSKGTIKNIVVKDSYFGLKYLADYTCRVSGVCGGNSGAIKNCHNASNVTVTVNSNYASVGGVCGQNFPEGIIENCNNTGEVNVKGTYSGYGSGGTGGVCGWNVNGTIKGCDNKGEVIGLTNVGGVCGSIRGTGKMQSCYNTAKVSGSDNVGGVCGLYLNHGTPNGNTIESCYNTGKVSGTSYVGGVCGNNDLKGTITNCYYDSGIYTGSAIGANNGTVTNTEGKTTNQFANGEVCYLLNGGKTDGSQAWYQTLSSGGEGYPNLNRDTENRTVYGAYQHGETRPTCSNIKSDLAMFHDHAYDSSAIDEANGNHDMSCEQNEQNPYTWTDIDNYSNATAKCNFICSVCNSEVAKDMNVTHNEEKKNEPAKCIEKGHNYYVASLTFNGTTYTNNYTQEVPDLGHDDSGDVTFNSGKSIYEKYCNRDGCGVLVGYYATSNGSVEATYEDGVYKVPIFCLNDGLTYNSKAQYTVESLEYKRMYYDDKWAAVYVPFAIDCSQLPDFMEMAVINNFHEYEQTDGSYNVVLEVKRKTSGTIPALTPCVMRLKEAPSEGFETLTMRFSNAVFSPAADKHIDCSSVTRYYKFSGSLAKIKGLLVDGRDFVLNAGKLYKANEQTVLLPQRWYLSAEDRAGSSTSSAAMLRSISINVIGDSDGDVTGIEDIHVVTEKATSARDGIFDMQGRRLNSEPTNGIYIKNGVKYVK